MPQRAAVAQVQDAPQGIRAGLGGASAPDAAAHGDLELNFVFGGSLRYFVGGNFVDVAAGTLAVFWAALPYSVVRTSEQTEHVFARVPLVTLLAWSLNASFMRKVLGGQLLLDSHGSAWDADLTRRWLVDAESRDSDALHTSALEIEARLRRFAAKRQQKAVQRPASDKGQRQVEVIARVLNQRYREDISTTDIGRAVHLHPNYAMTLFRRECGMSIWQYLIRLRLAQAQLLLLTTSKPVLTIALEAGFGSLARFYAAFTRECGTSPGEYRKLRQT
jgi:AraC-like DNA-binding protein